MVYFINRRTPCHSIVSQCLTLTSLIACAYFGMPEQTATAAPSNAPNGFASVEVRSELKKQRKDWRPALRIALEEEMRAIDWSATPRGNIIISTSLVRLDTEKKPGSTKVECQVSVSIRFANSSSLKAVVQGKAKISDGAGIENETDAIHAAVRGALMAVPTALKAVGTEA